MRIRLRMKIGVSQAGFGISHGSRPWQTLANGPNQTSPFNQVIDHSSKAQRHTRDLMSAHYFDEAQSGMIKLLGE